MGGIVTLPAEAACSAPGRGRLAGRRVLWPTALDRAKHEARRLTLTASPAAGHRGGSQRVTGTASEAVSRHATRS
jgi:hypothetical protein